MGSVLTTIADYHFRSQIGQEDPEERLAGLEALEARGDPKMLISKACRLLEDLDVRVRTRAVEVLVTLGSREAADAVAPVLESERAESRAAAADVLAGIGKAAVPATVVRLEHERPDVRAAAAEVLGRIPARSTVDRVISLLGDADPTVAAAAAHAIGRMGDVAHIPDLRVVYRRFPMARQVVLEALHALGAHEALDVFELAVSNGNVALREAALAILRTVNTSRARRILAGAAQDRP